MSFKLKKQYENAELVEVIIDNSDVVVIGDLVKCRNGNLEVSTAGGAIFGVVVDIVDKNGNSLFGSLAVTGSATLISGTPGGSGTVTVASDNETVDKIAARVNTSKKAIYSATVDGTVNTTSSSAKLGGWLNQTDANSVDETTHSRTITDVRALKGWGSDPDDTTRLLVSINHSEVWDNGAAMA